MSAGSSFGPYAKKAADFATEQDWPGYFKAVAGKPPRETLLRALELFERDGGPREGAREGARLAVDLGCGEGRDTEELLRRGWRVLAIDSHPEAFTHLRARLGDVGRDRLELVLEPFAEVDLPRADLVNASYSLPFCRPEAWPEVWRRVSSAVRPGGRFAGQLFGDRDDWAKLGDRTHLTRVEAEACFEGFALEMFEEEEKDDQTAMGTMKHWHVFHVVGRKI